MDTQHYRINIKQSLSYNTYKIDHFVTMIHSFKNCDIDFFIILFDMYFLGTRNVIKIVFLNTSEI